MLEVGQWVYSLTLTVTIALGHMYQKSMRRLTRLFRIKWLTVIIVVLLDGGRGGFIVGHTSKYLLYDLPQANVASSKLVYFQTYKYGVEGCLPDFELGHKGVAHRQVSTDDWFQSLNVWLQSPDGKYFIYNHTKAGMSDLTANSADMNCSCRRPSWCFLKLVFKSDVVLCHTRTNRLRRSRPSNQLEQFVVKCTGDSNRLWRMVVDQDTSEHSEPPSRAPPARSVQWMSARQGGYVNICADSEGPERQLSEGLPKWGAKPVRLFAQDPADIMAVSAGEQQLIAISAINTPIGQSVLQRLRPLIAHGNKGPRFEPDEATISG